MPFPTYEHTEILEAGQKQAFTVYTQVWPNRHWGPTKLSWWVNKLSMSAPAGCGFSNCAKQLGFIFVHEWEVGMHHLATLVLVFVFSPNIWMMMCYVLMELTWYDRSPWADVFINNVFSTLPSSDGRKISLKDAFPLGGITWQQTQTFR